MKSGGRWWFWCVLALELAVLAPPVAAPGLIRAPLPKVSETTSFIYPWQIFWRDEVRAGRAPFWNPFVYGGAPLLAEPQAQTLYPTHLLSLALPADLALKLSMLLQILLGSWLMYRLIRELGANRFGASVGALAFGLHGQLLYFVYSGWIQMISPMTWAPGVIWLLCRAFRRPRRAAARAVAGAALCLGLQILSGHPEWVRYTLLIAAIVTIVGPGGGRDLKRRAAMAAAVIALGACLGAPQLLPMAQGAAESDRGQAALQSANVRRGASLPPLSLPTIIAPRLFGPWDLDVTTDGLVHKLTDSHINFAESLIYVGVLPLLFACFARRTIDGARPLVWIVVAAVGVLFALNDWTHFQDLLDRVVRLDAAFRSPGRFVFLTNFSLAVLAGLGASALSSAAAAFGSTGRARAVANVQVWGLLAAALMFASGLAVRFEQAAIVRWALSHVHAPALVTANPLVSHDAGAGLAAWAVSHVAGALLIAAVFAAFGLLVLQWFTQQDRPLSRLVVLGAIAFELGWFAHPFLASHVQADDVYRHDLALLAPLSAHPDARVYTRNTDLFTSGPNVTTLARVRSSTGFDPIYLANPDRVWAAAAAAGPAGLAAAGITDEVVANDFGAATLQPIAGSLRRAWWSGQALVADSPEQSARQIGSAAASRVVALDGPHSMSSSGGALLDAGSGEPATTAITAARDAAPVDVTMDLPGRFAATVVAPRAGWLVVNEMLYPGWQATVNGRSVPVLRAFGGFQAIAVPAGQSTIVDRFEPTVLWWGLGLAALALALLGVVLLSVGAPRPGAAERAYA